MKRFFLTTILLAVFSNSFLFAQTMKRDIAVGIQFGTIEYRGDLGSEFFKLDGVHPSIGINLSKYVTPSFDLMGKIRHGMIDRNVFSNSLLDLNLTLKYKFNNGYLLKEESLFAPYLFIGIGDAISIYNNVTTGIKEQPLAEFNLPMGVGFQFNLTDRVSIMLETHYNYVINDEIDGVVAGKWDDSFLYNSVGFSYNIASGADSDGDGVKDKDDKCPNIAGSIESGGCPDSDGDGVIDIEDKCPNIAGIPGEGGCPKHYTQNVEIMAKARKGLFFDTGSARIKEESYKVLDEVVKVLKNNPGYKLNIDGHTDNTGDSSTNMTLSQKRAEAARNYIINKGIKPDRIKATGYGDTKPTADNGTEEGRTQNRRVEFNIRF